MNKLYALCLPLTMTTNGDTFTYGYDDKGNRVTKTGGINERSEYYLRDQTGKEIAVYQAGTDKFNNGKSLWKWTNRQGCERE